MNRWNCVIFFAILTGSQIFCPGQNVFSQEFGYKFENVIYEQPAYSFVDKGNLLNPDNDIMNLSHWTNKTWDKINLNVYYDMLRFNTQFRPTLFFREGDSGEFDFYTDEAYLDARFGKTLFLYGGKRNFVEGVAYGFHTTDFLGQFKKVDYTLREEERRVQREGNWLVGGDTFFKNFTFSAIYAPHLGDWQDEQNRVLVKGRYLAESINTDVALYLYYGDIPGLGLDISSTVSNNLVLYTESALRRGSQKPTITVTSMGDNTTPRTFQFSDPDQDKIYPQIVVGGNYTFKNGTTLIGEYIYNGDGYSSGRWKDYADFVKYNNESYLNNFFRGLATSNLMRGTSLMQFGQMRRNYAFLRLNNSTAVENLDGQLVFSVNLNDASWLGYLSLDYTVTKSLIAGLYSTLFMGKKDSEYGMQFSKGEVGLLLKYYFTVPNVFKSEKKGQTGLNPYPARVSLNKEMTKP